MSLTDFRFAQLKEGRKASSIFFMIDPSKIETQGRVLGLLSYCILLELKHHPNKQRNVYMRADKLANIPWPGLGSLVA